MSPQKPLFTGAVKIKLAQRYSKTFIQYSGSARGVIFVFLRKSMSYDVFSVGQYASTYQFTHHLAET